MAEAAKALGIGPEIEFRGRKYRLTPWTLAMTATFEAWLEQRAFDAVERTRGTVSEDVYLRRLDSVMRLVASGHFAFGGQAAADAARSLPGLKYSTFLQLQPANHDITEQIVHEMFEEIQAQVVTKMEAANANPDPQTKLSALASP